MKPNAGNSGKAAPGRPFQKGKSGNPSGRKKKSVNWKEAEDALREAIPRILLMEKNKISSLLKENPTGAEMLAAKYIHEHVQAAVDRFLGRVPQVLTGKDGLPLIPAAPAPQLIDFSKLAVDDLIKLIRATEPPNLPSPVSKRPPARKKK